MAVAKNTKLKNFLTLSDIQISAYAVSDQKFSGAILNEINVMDTHLKNNFVCWSTFIQKYSPSFSRVYYVFTKSTEQQFLN